MIRKIKRKLQSRNEISELKFQKGVFENKGGQIMFELQKTYKGDSRFKLDDRFTNDLEEKMLPLELKSKLREYKQNEEEEEEK